ncbi:threonine/serine exporter family protein [Nocardia sp. NBC_01503]|uniref:threonine/serine ThrE exporter family protein n=1 Tax=Nocardia sp. NBC_01503 TaxID=2975997 RepID=UPI002E7C2A8A|nr:threonine/serine exporter family protein [Nocardia sp. NBC_01503]WTL34832.1 threonine/serine exporter family protein [Nocardia sp. NBC_01503]
MNPTEPEQHQPQHRMVPAPRPMSGRLYGATRRAAGSMDRWLRRVSAVPLDPPEDAPEPEEPPVSADLLDLLRHMGVALIASGETTNQVQRILDDLARRYDADEVHFFVLPTGIFVRVHDSRGTAVDLLDATVDTLRLDQIAALYKLIDEIKHKVPAPTKATLALARILDSPPPTAVWLMLLGNVVLTTGLGLMLNPTADALPGYIVIGLVVQSLILLADRMPLISLGLPVLAGGTVTLLAFGFPHALGGGNPQQLLVPGVSTLLPGATLTNGSIELATGSMVAGASRTIYGLNKLLLLAFGVLIGVQLLGSQRIDPPEHLHQLGWWAPVLGVLLIGLGHSWRASAPPKSLPWLLVVLYAAFAAQRLGVQIGGGLLGSFLGGMVAVPAAYLVQRNRNAPPTQVTFLPAFWMLVPGGIGFAGVSQLVAESNANGLHVLVTTTLTVMAIALGVLVGSGLATRRPPQITPMVEQFLGPDTGRHSADRRKL